MSTNLDENTTTISSFQLKGGLYTLTTIQLLTNDLNAFEAQLTQKVEQAPNFFNKAPIIIDFKQINSANKSTDINFAALRKILKAKNLILIGFKNANESQQALAIAEGFAILRDSAPLNTKTVTNKASTSQTPINIKPQAETTTNGTRLITTPVRSGQQIYVPDGDLVITSSVSNGAELLASGNIHIYGALRGRALAGINGNKEARIFCSSLEAELVSIAGQFKMSEDIEKQAWKIRAEIYFKEGHLQIREL